MINDDQQKELRKRFNPEGSTLRKMQLTMVEMLNYFDDICKQHKIKYWLSSGTLLGAVRHGGFIPWDDDLDVEMFPDDYKKMCEVFSTLDNENYVLQTHATDPGYYRPCAKLRDKHSYIEDVYHYDLNYKYRGIFIDVFCIEPSSSGFLVRLTGGFENKVLYKLAAIKNNVLHNILVKPLYLLLSKVIYPVLSFVSRKVGDGRTFHHRMGMGFVKPRYKDDIDPLSEVDFEGGKYPAPANSDNYLRVMFGDYMRLPDLDKVEYHATKVEFYNRTKA